MLIAAPVVVIGTPYLLANPNALEDVYLHENDRVIDRLPVFPGAHEAASHVTAYRADRFIEASPIIGYRTTVLYEPPAGTTVREVVRFYRSRLSRWRSPIAATRCPRDRKTCGRVAFIRRGAVVVLNAGGVADESVGTFSVTVDYAGA